VLPELGGRIFSGLDKTDNYDFFYRQHVIKPALIGMAGAWISGGVEWNIPITIVSPLSCRLITGWYRIPTGARRSGWAKQNGVIA